MTIRIIKVWLFILWHIAYFVLLSRHGWIQLLEQLILFIIVFKLTDYYQRQTSFIMISSVFLGWLIFFQTNLYLLIDLYEKISFDNHYLRGTVYLLVFVTFTLVQLINFEKMMSMTQDKLYNHFHLWVLVSATLFVQAVFTYLRWFNLTEIESLNLLKEIKSIVTEEGSRTIFSIYLVLMGCFSVYCVLKKIFKGAVIHENTYR